MHQPFNESIDGRVARGLGGRFYGVYSAIVTDVNDPKGQGRVRVRLPWSPDSEDEEYEAWARLATMMGGADRGTWFIPDTEDEVLVTFEAGNPRRPYVVGGLWNGEDDPPEQMDSAGKNNKKLLCSRSGIKITMDDSDGQEALKLETPGGRKIALKDGEGVIELSDPAGNTIRMESGGVKVVSSSQVTIDGGAQVTVNAGQLTVNAGSTTFSGVVNAPTISVGSVIASSYTPAAGNML